MKDRGRLNAEIQILIRHFSEARVYWESQGNWVMIKKWLLPSGLTKKKSHVMVLIPGNYGNGDPLRDSFIDPDIKAYNGDKGQYENIPHYFARYPYTKLKLIMGTKEDWQKKGWQYICLHDTRDTQNRTSILNYLTHLYKFLAEPFRDWRKTFSSYGGN
jgi:hypothetical protein|tara:strand:- start:8143 stop:8619 length:477 start_codon:yes stop_codon:yes gene_type:complete